MDISNFLHLKQDYETYVKRMYSANDYDELSDFFASINIFKNQLLFELVKKPLKDYQYQYAFDIAISSGLDSIILKLIDQHNMNANMFFNFVSFFDTQKIWKLFAYNSAFKINMEINESDIVYQRLFNDKFNTYTIDHLIFYVLTKPTNVSNISKLFELIKNTEIDINERRIFIASLKHHYSYYIYYLREIELKNNDVIENLLKIKPIIDFLAKYQDSMIQLLDSGLLLYKSKGFEVIYSNYKKQKPFIKKLLLNKEVKNYIVNDAAIEKYISKIYKINELLDVAYDYLKFSMKDFEDNKYKNKTSYDNINLFCKNIFESINYANRNDKLNFDLNKLKQLIYLRFEIFFISESRLYDIAKKFSNNEDYFKDLNQINKWYEHVRQLYHDIDFLTDEYFNFFVPHILIYHYSKKVELYLKYQNYEQLEIAILGFSSMIGLIGQLPIYNNIAEDNFNYSLSLIMEIIKKQNVNDGHKYSNESIKNLGEIIFLWIVNSSRENELYYFLSQYCINGPFYDMLNLSEKQIKKILENKNISKKILILLSNFYPILKTHCNYTDIIDI